MSRQPYKHQQAADLSEYVFGKLPPQALPLEEAVLGAIMIEREAIVTVVDFLRPEHFYLEKHQAIFRACLHLFETMQPIDILTVGEQLKKAGESALAGGSYYLVEISSRVASAANLEYHARIVQQKYISRAVIEAASRAITAGYDESTDCFDLLERVESDLFKISTGTATGLPQGAGSLAAQTVAEAINARSTGTNLTGITTGFSMLDKLTGGWQKTDLVIVAARPGMGKTAWALATALSTAKAGNKVLVFSLEMSARQLMQRLISSEASIDTMRLRSGRITDTDQSNMERSAQTISELPIWIDDAPGLTITDLRGRARRHKMKYGLDLLVVDYLQLLNGSADERKRGNREQEISSIARGLKSLAKELEIPVISLAQLSRAVETRGGNKRPQLSDLRESGAIEQDADIVSFLYRAEYYGITEDEDGISTKGVAELDIRKNRAGMLGAIKMNFDAEYTRFSDPSDAFPGPSLPKPSYHDYTIPNSNRREPDEYAPF